MYTARQISPMIPLYDIALTSSFFTDFFHFQIIRDEKSYVILGKDNFTVHVSTAGPSIGEMEFYLEVDDVDSIWIEIKDKLGDIKARAPFDQTYGMRELHIVVPGTKTLMFIGRPIR